jgi:hypothetical protein
MPECHIEVNREDCTCTYTACSRRGKCCECLEHHWQNRELPGCLFPPEAEKTYDRSLEHFIQIYGQS